MSDRGEREDARLRSDGGAARYHGMAQQLAAVAEHDLGPTQQKGPMRTSAPRRAPSSMTAVL